MTRPAQNTDLAFFFEMYMHPEVNPFLLYEQTSKEAFEPIFADLLAKQLIYVFEYEGQPAGMFKLVPLTHRSDHIVCLGGVGIHPNFAGKGLGKTMMQEIIELGKSRNVLRIELSTSIQNERAIRLYEKVGFEREGILRKYTHLKSQNRFIDELMMAYLY